MKGFIDRTFLPGITYALDENNGLIGLLNGRSARIICTSDITASAYEQHYDNTGFTQLKKGTLESCGIDPVVTTFFGPVVEADERQRQSWLDHVAAIAAEESQQLSSKAAC